MQVIFLAIAVAIVITSIRVSDIVKDRKSRKQLERALLIRRMYGISSPQF